ncbi:MULTISPECIES: DUF4019 domain-containing protein [Brevundimonas]|uniref:DUF4019 domain-containing protein n=1 Tax=Brevundimonas TaxID=41275 RepID=UPI00320A68F5
MIGGANSLTEREKEVLRLLAAGHDAKSAAAQLDLSVHTINERLRAARRKLGVSSSRAAARVLAEVEVAGPQKLVDKDFGEDPLPAVVNDDPLTARRPMTFRGGLFGGLLLIVALAFLVALNSRAPDVAVDVGEEPSSLAEASSTYPPPAAQPMGTVVTAPAQSNAPAPSPASGAPGRREAPRDAAVYALTWLELVDRGDWSQSWRTASSTFQERMTEDAWTARAAQLDRPSGALVRVQQYAVRSASADSDVGDSVLIQYQASSDTGARVLETVALVPEGDGWKVSAYFTYGSPLAPAAKPSR